MSIETWRERLADAISGERADWHRVEVRPDDIRAALAAEADRAETRTIAARIERDARFRDALDALDLATLWLHRTMDLPHRDSQQAASWERKARSGRVALRAALAAEADRGTGEPIGSDPDNEVDAGDWFAADTPPSDAPERPA